ncbi:polyamine aminopropyltransferase [Marinobacterium litorale]|uniref:polyamine aminopropyltransferase n=1 Tax=Marinobacterium litorale TaxID=404770 RepID=UPI000410C1C2|nr:polyamine aminopropyltransferase [Marinobacterium litorale]
MKTPWFVEKLHAGYSQSLSIDELLFESKTAHQELMIFRNATFGRVLTLDGIVQTTERDEFIYHEMLAHVPIFAHGSVRRVLIIGGGDGGMLREVLRHSGVEQVVQVEIDQAVIDLCTTYLPNHSAGAFDDPRVQIEIADGVEFVQATGERFDLVISDCTDPVGPGEVLFSSPFYQGCKRCLNPGGVFVAQNGVGFMQPDELVDTRGRLGPLFADQSFYTAAVPSYAGGSMAFAWASDDVRLRTVPLDQLTRRFAQAAIKTRYYTPAVHQASFALPAYLLDLLDGL